MPNEQLTAEQDAKRLEFIAERVIGIEAGETRLCVTIWLETVNDRYVCQGATALEALRNTVDEAIKREQ